MTTPQITIYLDTAGALHAEAPGKNGTRRKIEINTSPDIYESMRAAVFALGEDLLSQRADELDRKRREADRTKRLDSQRHARIVEYTAAHYPSALKWIDPKTLRVFPEMRKKLHGIGYKDDEIDLMASRGELVGTAFFTMPARTLSSPQSQSKSERKHKDLESIAEIDI